MIDPFGGVALGAYDAMWHSIKWIGVELEQPFNDLGTGCDCTGISKADWVRFYGRWDRMRYAQDRYWCPRCLAEARQIKHPRKAFNERGKMKPHRPFLGAGTEYWQDSGIIPSSQKHHYQGNLEWWASKGHTGGTLLRGDSRALGNVVAGCDCCVASPPFVDSDLRKRGSDLYFKERTQTGRNPYAAAAQSQTSTQPYGTTPGQLGNLPPGSVDAAIASPPYAHGLGKEHTYADHAKREKDSHRGIMREKGIADPFYGDDPAQLGNLPAGSIEAVVSSPPFSGTEQPCASQSRGLKDYHAFTRGHGTKRDAVHTGETPGQLSAMKTGDIEKCVEGLKIVTTPIPAQQGLKEDTPHTFWEAAFQIVSQVFFLLRPGGHAIWVLKPYIRDRKIVPFPDQWRTLCEHLGFVTLHEHHALLVDSHSEMGLFGEEVPMYKKSSKSFFRRLVEAGGAPEINHETIFCMRKPADTGTGVIDAAVASPPYVQSIHEGNGIDHTKLTGNRPGRHTQAAAEGYGTSPGQLGAMRAGDIVAVIASPPYAGAGEVLGRHNGIDYTKTAGTGQRLTPGRQMYPYGDTEGQLGAMPAGRPPKERP